MSIVVTSTTDSKEVLAAVNGAEANEEDDITEVVKVTDIPDDSDSEKEEKEESEEKENEADEDSESEDDESEDKKEAASTDKPKKKGGFKRRIDKLSTKLSAAEQEIEHWREQALKYQKPESEKQSVQTKSESTGKPDPDNFDTHAEYVEAYADWKVEQKLSERDAAVTQKEMANKTKARIESHNQRVDTYKEKHPEFGDALADFFEDQGDDFKVTKVIEELITESDLGPNILHALINDPEEFQRINSLGHLAAARAIGRIEEKLESKKSSSDTKKQEIKTTKAPKPISPLNAGGKGSSKKSIDDPNISQREFERLMEEREAKRAAY